jgi:hypothetical protein
VALGWEGVVMVGEPGRRRQVVSPGIGGGWSPQRAGAAQAVVDPADTDWLMIVVVGCIVACRLLCDPAVLGAVARSLLPMAASPPLHTHTPTSVVTPFWPAAPAPSAACAA